ncbi:hypothetical protein L1987_60778 [Smallanthus sonchifolius]|uniref:Uncharacterized protein n=1 Tax=Smallanthus sonchifolius TaxID=185202 RepID=A0ACB9D9D1_9ASTR|nr:hypothetical protein L1987_60778 [Smallanthus sonchifolius]
MVEAIKEQRMMCWEFVSMIINLCLGKWSLWVWIGIKFSSQHTSQSNIKMNSNPPQTAAAGDVGYESAPPYLTEHFIRVRVL